MPRVINIYKEIVTYSSVHRADGLGGGNVYFRTNIRVLAAATQQQIERRVANYKLAMPTHQQ